MSPIPTRRPARALVALALAALLPMAAGCTERADATTDAATAANADAASDAAPATDLAGVTAATEPAAAPPPDGGADRAPSREPDVIYVPTPQPVVDAMLNLAEVKDGDVLYDLGSGDGRIPITAAKRHRLKAATGIDINPVRIREANENAQKEGVAGKVTFKEADLFTEDFSDATVITLYLLDSLNEKLRPTLLQLEPGTRIVSHAFRMGDWEPEQTVQVGDSTIYRWTVPARDGAGAKTAD